MQAEISKQLLTKKIGASLKLVLGWLVHALIFY